MRTLLYSASLSLLIAGCVDSKTDPPPTRLNRTSREIDNSQTVPEHTAEVSSEPKLNLRQKPVIYRLSVQI